MSEPSNPFRPYNHKPDTVEGLFSPSEVGLANRNHGGLLETLRLDVTPTGAHYLLNHFDIPIIDEAEHGLSFVGAFDTPFTLTMAQIRDLPAVTMPVTMECAGNGRAGMSPRPFSMPWLYEAVGTSQWTGTLLAPLIREAAPRSDVVDISFTGVDFGFDLGVPHYYGRSLSLEQLETLDVMLVYGMNDAPLLPQHGAPLRLIVPGWYGMASVKWLDRIEAHTEPYDGFQQVRSYRYRQDPDEEGLPVESIKVKSRMVPPGVPDWNTRRRYVEAGSVELMGRAWSGAGKRIERVEVEIEGAWRDAVIEPNQNEHAWTRWTCQWEARPGDHVLRCRATDSSGETQPLDPPWNVSGFANNSAQKVLVFVE